MSQNPGNSRSRDPGCQTLVSTREVNHGSSCCSAQNIENSFEAKKKAGVVFVYLTAAYDTVWHRDLTCKLLRFLQDKYTVRMIIEVVRNRSFTMTTGDSKQSRLCRRKHGVPQRLVLAPFLQHLYVRPAFHDFWKVCRRFSIVALFYKLDGLGGDFNSRHAYTFSISPDLVKG